ncbi:MAG: type II secretion system secretin GspD [Bdellovibrionales bacterium]|nr:type II secretion system secretin GspD [Bdellovibrionales bacterium]
MTSDNTWSTRMSFVFGLCALLGILLLILSEVGLAQTNGFRPGGAPIGNPLNDPGGDEEFDEFDDFDAPPPPRTRGKVGGRGSTPDDSFTGGISVGGTPDDKSGPALNRGKKGYELSGPGTEKGIKSKNEVPTLFVDNESGSGDAADREMITDFNFPDADIMDIAKTLGRLTGKNFILDKDVKGRVSVISNSPITVADAWRAFLTSLDMNGLAIVPTGKYLRIMRQNDAKGKNVRLYSNSKAPNTDALVTKIFKIKFISAKELENVIRTYANMGARIYGFEQTNTLIITDTGSNIDKIAKMIQFLDVEGFDAGIEVISVKFASAVEIQKLIDSLLPGTQAAFPGRPGFGGGGGGGGRSNFAARRTKEGGLINNIIADERTNTLIVHANPKGVEQVRALISRLDRKMPQALGGGKVHVVYLQFAEAEEMAKTLKDLSQSSRTGGGGPGFNPGGSSGGLGINPNEGALFEGQIRISPDKTTNSLVITSSPNDFGTIQRVINKLDIPRDQIYIEVVIMEMNMTRNNDFAANVLLPGGTSVAPTQDLIDWLTNPTKTPSGLVLRGKSGGKPIQVPQNGTNITVEVPDLAGLLKAVQSSSNGTILATPQIMTLENTDAIFDSTEKIPIPNITTNLGVVNAGVQFQDVPLTIKIKPQLNKISNFIKMDIKATVSDVSGRAVPEALQKQAFSTTKRSAETSLMVADGDTIVLGGLIRDKANEVINKVPLLGDIPILGWLFKSRSAVIEKNNLILFITPRIMRQPENVRMVLDRKLKERDEFVEKAFGGEDHHRDFRNNIIRNLPDVKSIKNYNPKKIVALDEDESKNDSKRGLRDGTLPEPMKEDSHDTLTLPPADGGAATGPITAPPVDAIPPAPDSGSGGNQ